MERTKKPATLKRTTRQSQAEWSQFHMISVSYEARKFKANKFTMWSHLHKQTNLYFLNIRPNTPPREQAIEILLELGYPVIGYGVLNSFTDIFITTNFKAFRS